MEKILSAVYEPGSKTPYGYLLTAAGIGLLSSELFPVEIRARIQDEMIQEQEDRKEHLAGRSKKQ